MVLLYAWFSAWIGYFTLRTYALIAALPIEDADAYKAPPYAQQATPAVESLKNIYRISPKP